MLLLFRRALSQRTKICRETLEGMKTGGAKIAAVTGFIAIVCSGNRPQYFIAASLRRTLQQWVKVWAFLTTEETVVGVGVTEDRSEVFNARDVRF